MQRFDILDPNLEIFQSRFLEASAGTGKTFAIEHLFIRLLLESKEPIKLGEILAVTFTREAAHEMKMRIKAKLEEQSHQGDRRIREALVNFDEIQVFTIHGFCHRMLKEFAFEAKAPLEIHSPNQPNYLQEMRQTVEDFFRTGEPEFSIEIASLLKRVRFNLDLLIKKIIEAIQKKEEPHTISFPEFTKVTLENLREDFFILAPRYKRLKKEIYERQLEKFHTFLELKNQDLLLQEKEWFFEKMHEENTKVSAKSLNSYSLNYPGFFETLHEKLTSQLQLARDPEENLKRVAKAIFKRWKVKAARWDHLTFDDLLHKMQGALSRPSFIEKIRKKYKAVIVDEFQDTDPIQWEIFEKLFLKSHLLYLIGDPKQSIYGFRSADIYTYMNAANALGKEKKAYLDTNFRSSPQLIDALNNLFTKNPNWIALPSMPDALSYHPVKAGRRESKLKETPIHYFGVKKEKERERAWPTREMEGQKLFPFIANEILRLHQKGISFAEMAILVKDRFQSQRMQLHLNSWKIPSIIKRAFNLAHSRGFLAMEMLLKAVIEPENERLTRAVLYGPLICNSSEKNELTKEAIASKLSFFHLERLFREKGFATFFSEFIAKHFQAHADPTLYLELRQTAEILMQQHRAGLEELLHFMQELKKSNPEIDERLILRGEEGKDNIQIMTTFASKGLEFDVVFALGPASRHMISEINEEKRAEKMRQLYVAFTRSREKLYIPILLDPSEKDVAPEMASPIEIFFADFTDWNLPIEWVGDISIKPYVKEEVLTSLIPPPKANLNFEIEYLTSFSAMAKPQAHALLKEQFQKQDLNIKSPHTLPLGAETGAIIHAVFETYFQDPKISLEQMVCETVNGTHLEKWEEVIINMVKDILTMPLGDGWILETLKEDEYFQEMEFLFPQGNQLIKGFVDLVFKRGDLFYLIDWKTNWLGPTDEDYTDQNLHSAMEEHDYYLQAKLYAEAVKRYVKRLYNKPQFGGCYYVFVRGKKAVHLGIC